MTTIRKSALVPYSAANMFALVDDVDAYSTFLPWCRSARVLSRDADEVRATIELEKGPVRKSFSTLNRLQRGKMIEMRLLEGPFKRLEGFWRFEELGPDGCRVSLDLDFEFSNTLLKIAVGPVFQQIATTLVDSFCQRAEVIYGRR